MGAAGDMLTSALLALTDDAEKFVERLNSLGIPAVRYELKTAQKCGITGSQIAITVNGVEEDEFFHHFAHSHGAEHSHEHDHHHEHHHSGMHEITHIVEDLNATDSVKKDILAVYQLIAEAESKVHGVEVGEIHFHEVGSLDAVADVAAVSLLIEALGVENIVASPVHVGKGTVKCAHGVLHVPAPATAEILKGCPIYSADIDGELCTPTGAALLKHFVKSFGEMPTMTVSSIGYGMGKKDFPRANCVRALLGEQNKSESVTELQFNVDDMTPEYLSLACEILLESGARDFFCAPVTMKKGRLGQLVTVICDVADKEKMLTLIFKHTTTIGVREVEIKRTVLSRTVREIETRYGTVREKISEGYGITRAKLEYEDVAGIVREQGVSVEEVKLASRASSGQWSVVRDSRFKM